jgi:hypothetical protein
MLKSYEVAIEGDLITWLGEKPKFQTTRAIVVIAEENKVTPIIKTLSIKSDRR